MPRPKIHQDDAALDAARTLVLDGGPAAATTAAISSKSGAPTGSIYHRFRSRNELLTELWVRTIKRFQAGLLLATADVEPGVERAVAAADWVVSFACHHQEDARLLMLCRREDLLGQADPSSDQAATLRKLNRPIEDLARQLADEITGAHGRAATETVLLAVMDLPYGAVRRHLRSGTDPAPFREQILEATRAILTAHPATTAGVAAPTTSSSRSGGAA